MTTECIFGEKTLNPENFEASILRINLKLASLATIRSIKYVEELFNTKLVESLINGEVFETNYHTACYDILQSLMTSAPFGYSILHVNKHTWVNDNQFIVQVVWNANLEHAIELSIKIPPFSSRTQELKKLLNTLQTYFKDSEQGIKMTSDQQTALDKQLQLLQQLEV